MMSILSTHLFAGNTGTQSYDYTIEKYGEIEYLWWRV